MVNPQYVAGKDLFVGPDTLPARMLSDGSIQISFVEGVTGTYQLMRDCYGLFMQRIKP